MLVTPPSLPTPLPLALPCLQKPVFQFKHDGGGGSYGDSSYVNGSGSSGSSGSSSDGGDNDSLAPLCPRLYVRAFLSRYHFCGDIFAATLLRRHFDAKPLPVTHMEHATAKYME
jgi:hypothetical protein